MTGRRRVWIAGGLALALIAFDWSRAPARQLTVRGERAAIARYQTWISPLLHRGGVRCRFEPSCSRYAAAVLLKNGALVGNARIAWRLLRCGPWTPAGTHDSP